MLIGYARVSKTDGSQVLDAQRDALTAAGVAPDRIYEDLASGRRDDRPGLSSILRKALKRDAVASTVRGYERVYGSDEARLRSISKVATEFHAK